jgi:hypothetical protein
MQGRRWPRDEVSARKRLLIVGGGIALQPEAVVDPRGLVGDDAVIRKVASQTQQSRMGTFEFASLAQAHRLGQ